MRVAIRFDNQMKWFWLVVFRAKCPRDIRKYICELAWNVLFRAETFQLRGQRDDTTFSGLALRFPKFAPSEMLNPRNKFAQRRATEFGICLSHIVQKCESHYTDNRMCRLRSHISGGDPHKAYRHKYGNYARSWDWSWEPRNYGIGDDDN